MTFRPALLALLLCTGVAHAEPAQEPAPLDLTNARVLASPGWPGALQPFLPPGREVAPLVLPLPPGPVLVLGLVGSDPVARAAGEALLNWKPGEDLRGGYVVEARRDGDRALAVILAEDAAALAAARFELETFTPTGKETEPRSVEFQKPDEQGGVRIALGRRTLRPQYRLRAAAGLGPGETLLDVVAAHANRMWVTPDISDRDLALLRDHGVEPVGWTTAGQPWAQGFHEGEEGLQKVLPGFMDLQRRGVRSFVLDWRRAPRDPTRATCPEDPLARRIADALRPLGLKELLILPFDAGDAARRRSGGPGALLRELPEAVLGWTGPDDQPLEITRAQAAERRKEAGVPVVLVETWMEAGGGEHPRIPSLPRGRAADLGDVLDGVVVLPGPGSAAALAAAWSPPESDAFAELGEVLGACVQNAKDGSTFLLESAACLEQTLMGRYADPPWLRNLPQRLRETAARLPPPEALLLARWDAQPVRLDGLFKDATWSAAPWQQVGTVGLAATSDGQRLVLGLRFPTADPPARVRAWGHDLLEVRGHHEQGQVVRGPAIEWAHANVGETTQIEVALGHYTLAGDPYPTRYLPLDFAVTHRNAVRRFGSSAEFGLFDKDPEAPLGRLLVIR